MFKGVLILVLSTVFLACSHSGEKNKNPVGSDYRRQVDLVLVQVKPRIKKCYEFLSKKSRAANSKRLVADWRIDRDGAATHFEINEYKSGAINLEISECLKNEFSVISFPAPPKGVAAVEISDYPIKFE